MIIYVTELQHRNRIATGLLLSISITLVIGFWNFTTINNLFVARAFIFAVGFILLAGAVLLSRFKRQLGFAFTTDSILLTISQANGQDNERVIALKDLDAYAVSYPKPNIYRISFHLTDQSRHIFHLTDRTKSAGREDVTAVLQSIHQAVFNYNNKQPEGGKTIRRRLSITSSNIGLALIISFSFIGVAFLAMASRKASVPLASLPLFLGFVFMAVFQRKKELNDFTPQ